MRYFLGIRFSHIIAVRTIRMGNSPMYLVYEPNAGFIQLNELSLKSYLDEYLESVTAGVGGVIVAWGDNATQ